MGREFRRQKIRKTVNQVAQALDGEQHAYDATEKRRPEDQVSEAEAREAKKYQTDGEAIFNKRRDVPRKTFLKRSCIFPHYLSGKIVLSYCYIGDTMANFCASCGGALTGGAGFCPHCGAQVKAQSPAAAPAPPQAPAQAPPVYAPPPQAAPPMAPPPRSGGSFGKILLVVFLIFLAFGAAGAAGFYYFVFKPVHHKYEQAKRAIERQAGVVTESNAENQTLPAGSLNACSLLSKDEASEILNTPIERTVSTGHDSETSCEYYARAEASGPSSERIREDLDKLKQQKQTGNEPPDAAKDLAKEMTGALAGATGQASGPYFGFTISRGADAGTAFNSFKAANSIFGAIPGAKTTVTGLGDEAFLGPMDSMLMVRKGNAAVLLSLQRIPKGRQKGIAIAHKILDRM